VTFRPLLAVGALLLIGGCALRARPAPSPSIPPTEVSAERLLASIDDRAAALRTFRALAQMHYVGPKESLAVKEVVAVQRPDRLRIEMMSAFGVALQITSDGQRLCAYHRGDRTFYRGRASADNLARFTRLDLGLSDMVDLLVGLPPARERRGRPSIAFERPQGWWRVSSGLTNGGTLDVWFDPDSVLPVRASETDAQGSVRYVAGYAQFQTFAGLAMPTEVRFEIPDQHSKIELRYSNVSVNTELSPALFSFEAPVGSKIVDLDALASDPAEG
jgi:outer membrane lipoprotein-sorting protein